MKKIPLILFFFCLAAIWGWTEFYTKLTEAERKLMSEAYYIVGQQYKTVGELGKGQEFITMAFRINPDLDPENISKDKFQFEPASLAPPTTNIADFEQVARLEVLLKSIFLRYMGAFIMQDTQGIAEFFDNTVYVKKTAASISRDQAKRIYDTLFQQAQSMDLPLAKLYNLETMHISNVEGGVFVLEVNSPFDLSKEILFWEHQQRFFVHKPEDHWVIFAIGDPNS